MPKRILITEDQFRDLAADRTLTFSLHGQLVEVMLSEHVPLIGDDPPQAREFLPRRRNNRK
jgi:hypothetical protein